MKLKVHAYKHHVLEGRLYKTPSTSVLDSVWIAEERSQSKVMIAITIVTIPCPGKLPLQNKLIDPIEIRQRDNTYKSTLAEIFVEVISFKINGISDWLLNKYFDMTSDFW